MYPLRQALASNWPQAWAQIQRSLYLVLRFANTAWYQTRLKPDGTNLELRQSISIIVPIDTSMVLQAPVEPSSRAIEANYDGCTSSNSLDTASRLLAP